MTRNNRIILRGVLSMDHNVCSSNPDYKHLSEVKMTFSKYSQVTHSGSALSDTYFHTNGIVVHILKS